jgi:hypothetical protein
VISRQLIGSRCEPYHTWTRRSPRNLAHRSQTGKAQAREFVFRAIRFQIGNFGTSCCDAYHKPSETNHSGEFLCRYRISQMATLLPKLRCATAEKRRACIELLESFSATRVWEKPQIDPFLSCYDFMQSGSNYQPLCFHILREYVQYHDELAIKARFVHIHLRRWWQKWP